MDFYYDSEPSEYSYTSEISDCDYFYNKFISLDKIVQKLFDNGLLTDIECRHIVYTDEFEEARVAIYSIICTKDSITFQRILQVFRNNVHPLQNPKILSRIFSFLKYDDILNCDQVDENWKELVDLLIKSKYDEISMDQLLLETLNLKQNLILNHESDLRRIAKMQATVFTLCLAIKPDKDETLHQLLQIKTERQSNKAKKRSIDECYADEDPRMNLIPKVLSQHTVLNTLFTFLSLQDIKTCRIVCRNWYSVAESFFRKQSVVQFYPSVGIWSFISVSKYTSHPDLPFTAFKFTGDIKMYELTDFFSKFGKNVKFLHLLIRNGIRSCLSLTPNLTELYLEGDLTNATDREVMIPFNKLPSIKSLRLSRTVVNFDFEPKKNNKRIIPLKIDFNNVRFYIDRAYPAEMTFNTVVDFSKIKDVHIVGCSRQIQIFDWASESFDAERMTFEHVGFVNVMNSKSTVDHVKLFCCEPFSEKANMSVKQLLFQDGTIKLSTLPQSLEKLGIYEMGRRGAITVDVTEQFYLPNLTYLSFRKPSEFNLLSHFDNSHNLTELEIVKMNALDTRWIPRSVKKLKLETKSGQINFISGGTRDLDLLILNYIDTSRIKYLNFEKIRPKVLVLHLRGNFNDRQIVLFLQRNKRMEKIYLQFMTSVTSNVFNHSEFSSLVDKLNDYYKFRGDQGRAITFEEFYAVKKCIEIKTSMKGFWNLDGEEYHKKHMEGAYSFHDDSDSDMSDNYNLVDHHNLDEDDDMGDWFDD